MKMKLIPALLASSLLLATPFLAQAQASAPAAAATQGQAGKVVIDASSRILASTLR